MSNSLKITDISVIATNPMQAPMGNFILVKISTNEPEIYGWGDATCSGSELGIIKFIEEHLKPALIERDPQQIENIFHTLLQLPYYRSGSVHMSAISGIDMALWDIKGKIAHLPLYELLGGKTRSRLLTYTSTGGRTFEEVSKNVHSLKERGYKVIKVQIAVPELDAGYAVPPTKRQEQQTESAYQAGVPPQQLWEPKPYVRILPRLFEHLRNEFGDSVEFIHDVHERINPNQAMRLARDLEQFNLFYYEDPLRPEHLDTFRLIRQQSSIPIAMGEVFCGLWDGKELILEHLVDYVRHDLAHVGGITAGRKIATLCEPFGILTAWHGPGNISPITHMANAHLSYSVLNFGIQEFDAQWGDAVSEVFSTMPNYVEGHITIGNAPGLGIDVDEQAAEKYPYIRRLRPMIRRDDDTPWAY